MRKSSTSNRPVAARLVPVIGLALALGAARLAAQSVTLPVRIMAANLTSGNYQSYEAPGIRIFQGLKPDIVALQEFRYNASTNDADVRTFVDTAFGTNFHFFKEYAAGYNIPNGIVSRWPIVAAGSWDDPLIGDRGFAWAHIALPGSNDLYVVSMHLYSGGTATDRNTEATLIKSNLLATFPTNAWVVVAGDCNTGSRTEAAITTFKSFLSDDPVPTDSAVGGNPDTNEPRNKPYDYLFPSLALRSFQTSVAFPSQTYANGLVFDSSVFATNASLNDIPPVKAGD
jgi:endonuclease/exonuclease/phosphatase family metal-dependent hydrolase